MKPDIFDPRTTTFRGGNAILPEHLAVASQLPSSTLHEAAGKLGALPSNVKPVTPGMAICGRAVTVQSPPGDNLWLHRAIYKAEPGDILVITVGGVYEHGYWGEIMSSAAKARNLGGMLIDGCVRDSALLEDIGFPVFARGFSIMGTGKDFGARGWINAPVSFHNVIVHPGDLIVGDADGIVCIPRDLIAETIEKSKARELEEADILRRITAGDTTLAIYGWEGNGQAY